MMKQRVGRWIRVMGAAAMLLALPLAAYAQCTVPGTDGLVGHWRLDESGATTTAVDSGSAGANGTLTSFADPSAAWLGSGQVDGTLDFAGDNDVVNIASSNGSGHALDLTGPMTLAAWVNPDAYDGTVIAKRDGLTSNSQYHLFVTPGGNVYFIAGGEWGGSTTTIPLSQWSHVAAVVDANNNAEIYINGIKQVWSDASGTRPYAISYKNVNVSIGARYETYPAVATPFNGKIDDVRIYNRALSDSEMAALYAQRSNAAPTAGEISYNPRHALLQYCDGTDWRMMGTGSYNPNAVEFDGTNDYMTGALTGTSDSNKLTISAWVRNDDFAVNSWRFILDTTAPGDISFDWHGHDGDRFLIGGSNASGTGILAMYSNAVTDADWHHVLFSVDLSDTNKRHLYVDGVSSINAVPTYDTSGVFDFTLAGYGIGAYWNTTNAWDGSIADLWIDFGTYIDLSAEANRQKFRSPAGLPMYLGEDGSIPTGSAPDIFLTGGTDSWHTNKGTGGGFTENGTLTTAATQPGEGIASFGDISTGLVARWALDETSGTTAVDSLGGNDGTLLGGIDAGTDSVMAQSDRGLTFNGTSDFINAGDFGNVGNGDVSVSFWMYADPANLGAWQVMVSDNRDINRPGWLTRLNLDPRVQFRIDDGTNNQTAQSSFLIQANTWYHIVGTFDGSADITTLYVNGVQEAQVTTPALGTLDNIAETFLGDWDNEWGNRDFFAGILDEVRIYNRVLGSEDIKLLYNCAAPVGAMKYDPGYNVMSYCNGAEWVAMGPVGGTPPASGLVGHWALDETTGTTADDSVGTVDGSLQGFTFDAGSTTGVLGTALEFTAANTNSVRMASYVDFTGQQSFSLAAWFRPSGDPTSSCQFLIDKEGDYSLAWDGDASWYSSGSSWAFEYHNESVGTTLVTAADSLVSGQWYFAVGVHDAASDTVSLYVNGELLAAQAGATSNISSSNLWLELGREVQWGQCYTSGAMDDVRIYNRVLTSTEVAQLYHFGLSNGLGDVSGNCASPTKPEGTMIYNADHNVMQYCNGENWIGIGQ